MPAAARAARERGEVDAAGQPTPRRAPGAEVRPAGAAVAEAAGRPGVGHHRGQVGADHRDDRAAAARRPALRDQLGAYRVGEPRVADEPVAGAPAARASAGSGPVAPAATTSSARSPTATRTRSSAVRVAGSTAAARRRAARPRRAARRSWRPRPGALATSTRSTRAAGGRPASLSRRSSSSCWAPGSSRSPWRGSSTSAAASQAAQGVVPPSRRWSTQVQARAGRCSRRAHALRREPARADAHLVDQGPVRVRAGARPRGSSRRSAATAASSCSGPRPGRGRPTLVPRAGPERPQLGEVADDVDAALLDPLDPALALLLGPG